MYRPCYHCEGGKYDPEECPQICEFGELKAGSISKEYVLYLIEHYGSMETWSKEQILSEIRRHVEEAVA